MPTKTKPQPPAKPPVAATRKALLAYHSELQKYHQKLDQWETLLTQKNNELIDMREEFEEMVESEGFEWEGEDEDECECNGWDAQQGCECGTCEVWRKENDCPLEPEEKPTAAAGDEVQFLENLFKLKDKRRKSVQRH